MSARYLIRLDDACHTMDRRKWSRIENLLDTFDVRPIVAVVPDNRDPDLMIEERDPEFWNLVRSWRDKGWAIAMHGYTHVMHETRSSLVLPFYRRSEFGGLPYAEQAGKIRASWKLFASESIAPTIWVAPAHSFDWSTLDAVREETPIRIVSDGIAIDGFFERELYWIPQQLWNFQPKKTGLWTVCLHPNSMTDAQFRALEIALRTSYARKVVSVGDLAFDNRPKSLSDHVYSAYFWQRSRALAFLAQLKRRIDE